MIVESVHADCVRDEGAAGDLTYLKFISVALLIPDTLPPSLYCQYECFTVRVSVSLYWAFHIGYDCAIEDAFMSSVMTVLLA